MGSGKLEPLADPGGTITHGVAARGDALSVGVLVVTVAAAAGALAVVGADTLWLAALGRIVAHQGSIPAGIPFAPGSTGHWPNPLVLAEIILHGLQAGLGERGLMLAQLAAVALAMLVLARDALAGGATRQGTAAALMLAVLGALPDLSVIRVQLFSVALFPVLAALLRAEARAPSPRIWLVVPLLALWANLHGGVLIGLGMTIVYLAAARLRHDPKTAVAVAVAAGLAICLTPAGIHTVAYYHGVMTNRAAHRGVGMWTSLSPSAPFDVLRIFVLVALAVSLRRIRPQLWELVILLILGALTLKTGRSGIWLLFFLVPLAARSFKPREVWDRLLPPLGTVALVVLALVIVRGPSSPGASSGLIDRAVALAHGSPVLAQDILAEQVALAGGRIVLGNPIDAFSRAEQDRYLDWLAGKPGGARAVSASVSVVLTSRDGPARRLMDRQRAFRVTSDDGGSLLFTRIPRLAGIVAPHPQAPQSQSAPGRT